MMPSQIPRVTVDGSELRPEIATALIDAVIDDDLYLPDMFELRFADPDRTLAEKMPFSIGAEVEIKTGALGADASTLLINGEVTAVEAILDATGSFLSITGYDQSHRLHRGRRTATFNDITDSDLARKIASDAGLSIGTIDATTTTLEHVSQVNDSDWTFLQRRARESGSRVFVKEGKFHFRTEPAQSFGPPAAMRYGRELIEFRARMTANEQVGEVEVRGWDFEMKEAISERLDTEITSAVFASSSIGADAIDSSFGRSTYVSTDLAIGTGAAAREAAGGLQADMSSAQLFATGTVVGDPRVTADSPIEIIGTGKAFDGTWQVSHSRHVFDHAGYTTHFTVSGTQDRSLAGVIAGLGGGSSDAVRTIDGVVIGVVTDTIDPLQIGRVKVQLPWLSDDYETFWARVCYPGAGPERGLFLCPEINDEVLIAFEHGDIRQPFVVGSLFNGKDKPGGSDYTASSDGSVIRRAWTSRNGHRIVILEDPGSPEGDMINLVTKSGVVMNLKDDGELFIDAKNVIMSISENVEISATGDLKIDAKNVTITARSALELGASSGATIDGGAQTEIKGGMVKLN